MGSTFNPTPAEANILQQVAARESSGKYSAVISPSTCYQLTGGYNCTASGAYGFTNATWQMAAQATGVGDPYSPASQNSQLAQDTNALWLLRYAGGDPNASVAWGASGPYDTSGGSSGALVDLSGSAASAPTADIMSQINASAASVGIDLTSPTTAIVAALGVGLAAYLVLS